MRGFDVVSAQSAQRYLLIVHDYPNLHVIYMYLFIRIPHEGVHGPPPESAHEAGTQWYLSYMYMYFKPGKDTEWKVTTEVVCSQKHETDPFHFIRCTFPIHCMNPFGMRLSCKC